MISYLRLMFAEPIKYRRSAVIWLALGVPSLFNALMFLTNLFGRDRLLRPGATYWTALGDSFGIVWTVFVLPIGALILAALACNQVQADGMWRAILLQPVRRSSAYLAHLTGVLLVILAGSLVISLGMLLTGLVLFAEPVNWSVVLIPVGGWLAMLPGVAIQVYLGTRLRSIAVPLAAGMGGYVAGLVGRQLGLGLAFPWIYPLMAQTGDMPALILPLSAALFAGLALLGMAAFRKMDTF